MWNSISLIHRRSPAVARLFQAGALLCAFALAGPLQAQTPPPAPPAEAPSSGSVQDLRQTLEESYEVLPLQNGVMLRPRAERLGVRTIEVSGGSIAVNGERVTEGVLRAWLAADADPVLRLYRLSPRQRQELFGLLAGGARPAEAAEPETEEETEIPAEEEEIPAETADVPSPPETPEPPQKPEYPAETSGSQLNFGNNITIDKDELVEEAVSLVGSVRVDGEVSRDVVALAGSVTINGRVGGNVTAVGGDVRLGPEAVVDGDVTSVGGKIVRAEGAQVHGKTTEAGMVRSRRGGWDDGDIDIDFHPWLPFVSGLDLIFQLIGVAILGLLVCLCLLVAPGPLEKVERHVEHEPWIAGLVGLAAQLLFVPLLVAVSILLVVTIVGCALFALYPFVFIAIGLAALLGYAAVAHRVGRFLEARFNRRFGGPYLVALVGVLAIEAWSVLGRLVGLGSGPLTFIAFTILAFGFAVQYVAWTVGFGAVLRARFGGTQPPPASLPPAPVSPPPAPVLTDPVAEDQLDQADQPDDPDQADQPDDPDQADQPDQPAEPAPER